MSETPTAPSQKNRNTLQIIVVAMLILIALMLLFNMQQQGSTKLIGPEAEKAAKLRQLIAKKEAELTALGIQLPADTSSIQSLTQRISRDAEALRTNVESIQTALSQKEAALTKAQLDFQGALSINQSLSAEASKLREQLAKSTNASADSAQLKEQVAQLTQQLAASQAKLKEYESLPSAETVAQFRASLNETMLANEGLNKKVAELESKLAESATATADLAKAREDNTLLVEEIQELRAKLSGN